MNGADDALRPRVHFKRVGALAGKFRDMGRLRLNDRYHGMLRSREFQQAPASTQAHLILPRESRYDAAAGLLRLSGERQVRSQEGRWISRYSKH